MIVGVKNDSLEDMVELAVELAKSISSKVKAGMGKTAASRKADASAVTQIDHDAQAHILGNIARCFPDHAVIAEETIATPGAHPHVHDARFTWVVDPIDGTRNLVVGFPCVATSIGILDQGLPVAAVVVEHNLGEVYTAIRNQGATLDGQPINVCDFTANKDYLVGAPSTKDPRTGAVLKEWIETKHLILRNLGSSAYHLAQVAAGRLSASFAKRCKIWDIAAGQLLITEAGGLITSPTGKALIPFDLDMDTEDDVPFLAATPDLHEPLLKTTRPVFQLNSV